MNGKRERERKKQGKFSAIQEYNIEREYIISGEKKEENRRVEVEDEILLRFSSSLLFLSSI